MKREAEALYGVAGRPSRRCKHAYVYIKLSCIAMAVCGQSDKQIKSLLLIGRTSSSRCGFSCRVQSGKFVQDRSAKTGRGGSDQYEACDKIMYAIWQPSPDQTNNYSRVPAMSGVCVWPWHAVSALWALVCSVHYPGSFKFPR